MRSTASITFFILICLCLPSCNNTGKTGPETETEVRDTVPVDNTPQYLYVTAVSGLSLREHPNLQSTKLTVMPLGSKVKIINSDRDNTLNVGGIDGNMDEVEFDGQRGYAFNGFLSPFPSTGPDARAKEYADELAKSFPEATYSETVGDSVTKPKKIQTLILPTDKWHEAFFTAQQLYGIPHQFFPIQKDQTKRSSRILGKIKTPW